MSVAPGIYVMRSRSTGYYIVPDNDGVVSGAKVTTMEAGDVVPEEAPISVSIDQSGLYTLRLQCALDLDDAGDGKRYFIWNDGSFKWVIEVASAGLWVIKVSHQNLYWDDDLSVGNNVILEAIQKMSDSCWEFISSG